MALNNLRAVTIVIVVAMHSVLAYLGSAVPSAFDKPPYIWRAFPIIDAHRWIGFDIFCAWQDVYLMALLFFLSGVFTWPSLARKGTGRFLRDRSLRLGVPYLFGVLMLMPLFLYPVYRTRAADPSLAAYAQHLFALPFWDNGPMWFLWQLLAFTFIAAALCRLAPRAIKALGALSANAEHPSSYFLKLAVVGVAAYVPLALVFTPMAWATYGPLTMQLSRPLFYLIFYLAGLGVGVRGVERGLLAADGALARDWTRWLAGASLSFVLWLGLTAFSVLTRSAPLGLEIAIDTAFAIAAAFGCFAALALSLRFAAYSRVLHKLAKNALGLYLVHCPIAVWLQYALLGMAVFAFAKAMIVLGLTLVLSLALVIGLKRVPFVGARLVGEAPRPFQHGLPRLRPSRPSIRPEPLLNKWLLD